MVLRYNARLVTHFLPEPLSFLGRLRIGRVFNVVADFFNRILVHAMVILCATSPVLCLVSIGHAKESVRGSVVASPAMSMSFPSVPRVVSSFVVARLARVHVLLTGDPFAVFRLTPASCPVDTKTPSTRGLHFCHNVS